MLCKGTAENPNVEIRNAMISKKLKNTLGVLIIENASSFIILKFLIVRVRQRLQ
jgi:hypothetical protein